MLKTLLVLCLAVVAIAMPLQVTVDPTPPQMASDQAPADQNVFPVQIGISEAQASTEMWMSCCVEGFSFGCCVMWVWSEFFEGDW